MDQDKVFKSEMLLSRDYVLVDIDSNWIVLDAAEWDPAIKSYRRVSLRLSQLEIVQLISALSLTINSEPAREKVPDGDLETTIFTDQQH